MLPINSGEGKKNKKKEVMLSQTTEDTLTHTPTLSAAKHAAGGVGGVVETK